jgi:SpoVK/Ycf46/Vps4 family AAA+-type ATPase
MSKPQITSARQSYIDQLDLLSAAAVGVVLTRTREPHRAEEAIKEWTFTKKRSFKSWNAVRGWKESKPDMRATVPPPDKVTDFYLALQKIADVAGNGAAAWQDITLVAHYPHWNLAKSPAQMQLLKEYSRDFTETKQRLVLLVPEAFVLPPELQNDIAVLDFGLPYRDELREIYDNVMDASKEVSGHSAPYNEDEIGTLLGSGAGMTEAEFEMALSKAILTHKEKWPKVPVKDMNRVLLEAKTDVVKRSEILELMDIVDMKEVGGLDLAKDWIAKRKRCFTQEATDFGVDRPKGIAAIGPPGTGKSLFAKALAGLLSVPLIKFDVSKVFGSLVGQTETKTHSALMQCDAMAPCVVLIDEVDKAGIDPRQGGGDSGTSKRVIGKILTHMQESKAPIFWVLTANRVDGLPPELLRKGRLDEVFAILPPNKVERMEIVKIHLRKRKQDPSKMKDLSLVVDASEGFVSAELEGAVKDAVIEAFTEGTEVTGAMIAEQLKGMKPISVAFADDFNAMKEWAANNARMASTQDEVDETVQFRPRRRRMEQ